MRKFQPSTTHPYSFSPLLSSHTHKHTTTLPSKQFFFNPHNLLLLLLLNYRKEQKKFFVKMRFFRSEKLLYWRFPTKNYPFQKSPNKEIFLFLPLFTLLPCKYFLKVSEIKNNLVGQQSPRRVPNWAPTKIE